MTTSVPPQQPPQPTRRGLAITAMLLGLFALLTVAVGMLWFTGALAAVFACTGVAAALAAITLGVVSLVKRQPRAPGITGVSAAVLACAVAAVWGLVAVTGLLFAPDGVPQELRAAPEPAVPDDDGTDAGSGTALAPTRTPSNAGGVFFIADDGDAPSVLQDTPSELSTVGGNARLAPSHDPRHHVRVYVDYRCPHCAAFDAANGNVLEEVVAGGDAVVEVVPLTFLDRQADTAYSSRAANAMLCVAHAQPGDAWAAHAALLDPDFQPDATADRTDEDILAHLGRELDAVTEDTAECVTNGTHVAHAQDLTRWAFDHPVPGAQDPALAVQGTPFVLVDGVPFEGTITDPASLVAFLDAFGVDASDLPHDEADTPTPSTGVAT